jgi:hypothetical protein
MPKHRGIQSIVILFICLLFHGIFLFGLSITTRLSPKEKLTTPPSISVQLLTMPTMPPLAIVIAKPRHTTPLSKTTLAVPMPPKIHTPLPIKNTQPEAAAPTEKHAISDTSDNPSKEEQTSPDTNSDEPENDPSHIEVAEKPSAKDTPPLENIKQEPITINLVYEAKIQGLTGEATYNLWHDGTRYRIQFNAKGTGLAGLLGISRSMQSEGRIEHNGLHPESFWIKRSPNATPSEAIFMDSKIKLHDGSIHDIPSIIQALDPLSITLQFYFDPPTHSTTRTFLQVRPTAIELYRFKKTGSEKLEINGNLIDTDVWERHDNDSDKLKLKLWLAPKLYYVPIQIYDYSENLRILKLQRINDSLAIHI